MSKQVNKTKPKTKKQPAKKSAESKVADSEPINLFRKVRAIIREKLKVKYVEIKRIIEETLSEYKQDLSLRDLTVLQEQALTDHLYSWDMVPPHKTDELLDAFVRRQLMTIASEKAKEVARNAALKSLQAAKTRFAKLDII